MTFLRIDPAPHPGFGTSNICAPIFVHQEGGSMGRNKMVLQGLGLVVVAAVLMSKPRCNRGCRTLLEHILYHGLDDLLGGVLA
jgi:hypothetical protein